MKDSEVLDRARKLMQIPDLAISIEEAKLVIKFFNGRRQQNQKFMLKLIQGGKK